MVEDKKRNTKKWPVRRLLKIIYDKDTSEEQKEDLKKELLKRRKEVISKIALYDGTEQKLAKRFLAETEEIKEEKEIKPVAISPEAKIEALATQYSYAEVLKMAKEQGIQPTTKMKMIPKLIEKKVL